MDLDAPPETTPIDADARQDVVAPPRPDWVPPFDVAEEVGWGTSHDSLCVALPGVGGASVFSDARGVFAFASVENNELAGYVGPSGYYLYLHDGTGWQPLLSRTDDALSGRDTHLTALPDGALFLVRSLVEVLVSPDGASYVTAEGDVRDAFAAQDLAYVLFGSEVRTHDGDDWVETFELPAELKHPSRLWARQDFFVVAGYDQRVAVFDGTFQMQDEVPSGDYTAVWAFDRNDIWLGNYAGQLVHFDGAHWSTEVMAAEGDGIHSLWGSSDGRLYFAASTSFGYVDSSGVHDVAQWSAASSSAYFAGMWGNDDRGEVYLSVSDRDFFKYACGGTFMVWFDGDQLHQF